MSIEVKNLNFSYGDRPVLHDISFKVEGGEVLSILGPNGVGKSTLFRCVLGLLSGYTGQVLVDGVDARSFSVRELSKHIAYIPQSSHPIFNYSAFDIVLMGRSSGLSTFQSPGKKDTEICHWAMDKVGISRLSDRCFHRLSGGEQQLVLIARALVQNAPILMLDEPTENLDFGNQLLVLEQAQNLAREGYTVIQTTHHPEQSYMFSDRILTIQKGRVLNEGKPGDVLTQETMQALYGVDVEVVSLYQDCARICIPKTIIV
ncbi:ABC transporter ATP-binding protein [Acetivibrio ethanolgignens]|uniref:ABC transporter n=1 Tax=Acetivibrio ethanolgignens TaxID=290052 RepID=A0A0V8QC82_9FIRM|nr:ABC transporter ATP-binding protein [Acetivibrio ethanolgignens]KSV57987.1 ABC transporter [Acetivibrio ethanolgignens]